LHLWHSAVFAAEFGVALDAAEQLMARAERDQDGYLLVCALGARAIALGAVGRMPEAVEAGRSALARSELFACRHLKVLAAYCAANALAFPHTDEAIALFEYVVATATQAGLGANLVTFSLRFLHGLTGGADPVREAQRLLGALKGLDAVREPGVIRTRLYDVAQALATAHRFESAAMMLGAADTIIMERLPESAPMHPWFDQLVTTLRDELGEERAPELLQHGRSLTLEQAVTTARGELLFIVESGGPAIAEPAP
jgi:hypothetical protein